MLEALAGTLDREHSVEMLVEVEAALHSIEGYANIRLALENLMLKMPRREIISEYQPGE